MKLRQPVALDAKMVPIPAEESHIRKMGEKCMTKVWLPLMGAFSFIKQG